MSIFPNKFPSNCSNKSCSIRIEIGYGYVQKNNEGKYVSWCKNCVPEKIGSNSSRYITELFEIFTPYDPEVVFLIKSLPKAKWNPSKKCWTVSKELADRRRILEVANTIGLSVPESIKIEEVLECEVDQDLISKIESSNLYPFQKEGSTFCIRKKKCLLGDEMGLGKSVQALMSIPNRSSSMVICRAGIKYNWLDEINKWRPDLKPKVLSGRDNFCWPDEGEIVIINHDILPKNFQSPSRVKGENNSSYLQRLRLFRKELASLNPKASSTILIVDEAHDFKTYSSQRSKKVKEICRIVSKVIGLTGSPLTNRPPDLYGVFDVLGIAGEVFGSFERFKSLFNAKDEVVNKQGQKKIIWGLPNPLVPELLKRSMLRRLRKDVLPDLPSKTYTTLFVDLDSSLKVQMDGLWKDWSNEMQDSGDLPPFTCFSEVRKSLAHSRIPAMLNYIEDAEEQQVPLVVFSSHLSPLNVLVERPGWAVISGDTPSEKRQEIVRLFQSNKLMGVGVSIRAGGVGITLTNAWKALFIDLDWTPAANWQAEDRIARIGQKSNKVEIVRMISSHPLDMHVHKLLAEKISVIQDSIDRSFKFKPKQQEEFLEETDNQFEERIKRMIDSQKIKDFSLIRSKVALIHEREKIRSKISNLFVSSDKIKSIKEAFAYMVSVCDGATTDDRLGFNKPDAMIAHWVLSSGLKDQIEIETAYLMLIRYQRQLKKKYPIIFQNKENRVFHDDC